LQQLLPLLTLPRTLLAPLLLVLLLLLAPLPVLLLLALLPLLLTQPVLLPKPPRRLLKLLLPRSNLAFQGQRL
jgi:hypothetical protein